MKKQETRGGWNKKYTTEHQRKKAIAKQVRESHKRTQKTYAFHFGKVTDKDIIEHFEQQENKSAYIKNLIRQDIKNKQ